MVARHPHCSKSKSMGINKLDIPTKPVVPESHPLELGVASTI